MVKDGASGCQGRQQPDGDEVGAEHQGTQQDREHVDEDVFQRMAIVSHHGHRTLPLMMDLMDVFIQTTVVKQPETIYKKLNTGHYLIA